MLISAFLKITKFKKFFLLFLVSFTLVTILSSSKATAASSQCPLPSTCSDGSSCTTYGDLADGKCTMGSETCCTNPSLGSKPADTGATTPATVPSSQPPGSGGQTPGAGAGIGAGIGGSTGTNPYAGTPQIEGKSLTVDNYKAPQHSNYTMLNLGHTLLCMGNGADQVTQEDCIGLTKQTTPDGSMKIVPQLFAQVPDGGALGGLNKAVYALYTNPPTSTMQYLASVGTSFGLIKPAYAQFVGGSGQGVIEPVIKIWQVMRNLAYLIFIVIFVVVGFMIMFRQKINPQTVISAQTALPGLVVGLILVTFSYFLSALIVDLAFVGARLVGSFFIMVDPNRFADAMQLAQSGNVFDLWRSFTGTFLFSGPAGGVIDEVVNLMVSPDIADALGKIITPIISVPLFAFTFIPGIGNEIQRQIGQAAGGMIGTAGGMIIVLIILIALIIQFFRLVWALVTCYIAILVTTMASPLIILVASIPGRGGVLSAWWRTLLGNVLVFPAVLAGFFFAGLIMDKGTTTTQTLPLFGIGPDMLRYVIGLGIILGLPAIPKMVKDALKVPDLKGIPEAALAGAGAGASTLGMGAKTGYGKATAPYAQTKGALEKYSAEAEYARLTGGTVPNRNMNHLSPGKERLLRWWPGLKNK